MIRDTVRRNEALLDLIRRYGPLTTNDVADRYGWKQPYAYKQLNALEDEGLVTSTAVTRQGVNGFVNVWEAT